MKISTTKNKKSTKVILGLIGIVIALLVGYGAYALINNSWPFPSRTNPENGPSEQEKQTMEKQSAQDKQAFLDNEVKTTRPEQPEQSETADDTLPSIDISAKKSDDKLIISTDLSTTPSGTCTLTLSKDSQLITKNAQIIYTPEYSTCAGFSVSTKELSRGVWNISLLVKSGNASTKKTISFEL